MRDLYQAFAEAKRLNKKRGFTLIELLVVIAIIAILAAIAIPQFAKYRVRAFNSAAESDLRNIRTTMEAIYADYQSYGNNTFNATTGILSITTPGGTENVSLSNGVYAGVSGADTDFAAASGHKDGDREFCVEADSSSIYWNTKTRGSTSITSVTADSTAGDNECTDNGYTNQL